MLCLSGFELYSRWVPLFKDPGKKANRPYMHVLCALNLRPTRTHLFENGYFFPPVWPTRSTRVGETVTENGCFQKRSPV